MGAEWQIAAAVMVLLGVLFGDKFNFVAKDGGSVMFNEKLYYVGLAIMVSPGPFCSQIMRCRLQCCG